MPLVEGTGFSNVFFNYVLDPLRKKIQEEFVGANVYIGESYKESGNLSMKLFGLSAETEDEWTGEWQKRYNIEVTLYSKGTKTPSDSFYKQFYADSERLYQMFFENKVLSTTVGSTTLTWIEGKADSIEYNELDDDEAEVDGLNKASFEWSCLISFKA